MLFGKKTKGFGTQLFIILDKNNKGILDFVGLFEFVSELTVDFIIIIERTK